MRWLPAAMIVCSVVFELLTPAEYAATPLFAVACVTAGAILSRSGTAWTVGVAVCATVVLAVLQDRWGHVAGTAELADVAAAGLAAFWVNWLVARQRSRLAVARGVAEEMQRVLLPAPPPVVGGLEIAARYEPNPVHRARYNEAYAALLAHHKAHRKLYARLNPPFASAATAGARAD